MQSGYSKLFGRHRHILPPGHGTLVVRQLLYCPAPQLGFRPGSSRYRQSAPRNSHGQHCAAKQMGAARGGRSPVVNQPVISIKRPDRKGLFLWPATGQDIYFRAFPENLAQFLRILIRSKDWLLANLGMVAFQETGKLRGYQTPEVVPQGRSPDRSCRGVTLRSEKANSCRLSSTAIAGPDYNPTQQ